MTDFITVKLFADLGRNYEVSGQVELRNTRNIKDIIADIGIPAEKVTIIFVDGRHAEPSDQVRPGQVLSLFPPVGGG